MIKLINLLVLVRNTLLNLECSVEYGNCNMRKFIEQSTACENPFKLDYQQDQLILQENSISNELQTDGQSTDNSNKVVSVMSTATFMLLNNSHEENINLKNNTNKSISICESCEISLTYRFNQLRRFEERSYNIVGSSWNILLLDQHVFINQKHDRLEFLTGNSNGSFSVREILKSCPTETNEIHTFARNELIYQLQCFEEIDIFKLSEIHGLICSDIFLDLIKNNLESGYTVRVNNMEKPNMNLLGFVRGHNSRFFCLVRDSDNNGLDFLSSQDGKYGVVKYVRSKDYWLVDANIEPTFEEIDFTLDTLNSFYSFYLCYPLYNPIEELKHRLFLRYALPMEDTFMADGIELSILIENQGVLYEYGGDEGNDRIYCVATTNNTGDVAGKIFKLSIHQNDNMLEPFDENKNNYKKTHESCLKTFFYSINESNERFYDIFKPICEFARTPVEFETQVIQQHKSADDKVVRIIFKMNHFLRHITDLLESKKYSKVIENAEEFVGMSEESSVDGSKKKQEDSSSDLTYFNSPHYWEMDDLISEIESIKRVPRLFLELSDSQKIDLESNFYDKLVGSVEEASSFLPRLEEMSKILKGLE